MASNQVRKSKCAISPKCTLCGLSVSATRFDTRLGCSSGRSSFFGTAFLFEALLCDR